MLAVQALGHGGVLIGRGQLATPAMRLRLTVINRIATPGNNRASLELFEALGIKDGDLATFLGNDALIDQAADDA